MKLKLPTIKLQEMVSKSIKGCSFNKLVPLSQMIAINLKDNKLSLTTTDAVNYFDVKADVAGEDFYTVVEADAFSKLIAKLTCDNVEMEVTDDSLTVIGNGTYKFELPLDVDGTVVKFPNPITEEFTSNAVKGKVSLATIRTIVTTAKASLADLSSGAVCYTGYYFGDKVIATDGYQICGIDVKMFDTDLLLNPTMLDLVSLMSDESITTYYTDEHIMFKTDNYVVFGNTMDKSEFDINSISALLGNTFTAHCKVSKSDIMSVLDRLVLFVKPFEENRIKLAFIDDGIEVNSNSQSATELIKYRSKADKLYNCDAHILMLYNQLKSYGNDEVDIWYSNEENNAIKLVDGSITQLIALLEEK